MRRRTNLQLKASEGFGLVEIIVVVAILGVLTLVAIPVYGAIQETTGRVHAQKVTNELYTSVASIHKSKGVLAAADYAYKINQEDPTLVFVVSDAKPMPGYDDKTRLRYTAAKNVAENPAFYDPFIPTYRSLRTLVGAPASEHPGEAVYDGNGEHICVVGLWTTGGAPGEEKLKQLFFAGPGCGSIPYKPGE